MSDPESPEKIDAWLQGLNLGQYASLFAEHGITFGVLLTLGDADLRELGITAMGHRKKILRAIADESTAARPVNYFVPPPTAITRTSGQTLHSPPTHAPASAPAPRLGFWAKLVASKFLFVSIVVHLLFGVGATYYIVQRIQAKRKVTFQGGPPSVNPSKRALEHKVSMAQKKKTGGAPPQAKRIVSAGIAKVALPDLPTISSANNVVPGMMAGMGGVGTGTGMGFGAGMGSGMGGGGGGGGMSFFGFRGGAQSTVFVIDISGSMISGKKDRESYDRLEKETIKAINGLSAASKLNLIVFSRAPYVFSETMVSAGVADKERAINWLKSYSPCNALPNGVKKGNTTVWQSEKGKRHMGTGSNAALKRAFELQPALIFFVSDGEPTDARPPAILKNVEEWQKAVPRKVTINAIAYEADAGGDFMSKLAKENGGAFKDIK
jgi:hypothetical protein